MNSKTTHKVADLIASGKLWIGDGYRAKNSELGSAGIPFARAGDINDGFHFKSGDHLPEGDAWKAGNKLSEVGDVVFTSKGTVGRFGFVTKGIQRFVYSPQLCFWRSLDNSAIDPRFLFYWVQGKEFYRQYKSVSQKTDMAEYVSLSDQRSMEVTLPLLEQQKAIAHILGTLDDKIGLNRKTNETLEGIAKALFKSWFVDFDPVKAKAEGRSTGLPEEISDFFPDSFEESELGEIPSGWTVDSFTSEFNVLGGGTPKTSVEEFWDGDLPWFSVVDAPSDSDCWVIGTQKTITSSGLENCSSDLLRKGTTIISARGTVGKVCLVGRPMAMNQSCYALQSKKGRQDTYCYYSTKEIVEILKARAHGSVFSTITRDTLHGVNICCPDPVIIDAFEELSSPLLEKVKLHVDESSTICSIRDALLSKLVSGELRIPDAEKMLEEVGI
jgi:type I restriction enzyme S subunit